MIFISQKTPTEVLDFIVDYVNELALSDPVDVIASSAWTQEDSHTDDLTIAADIINGTDAIVRVSGGGRLGVTHYLVNRVTTVGGLIHQRTIKVTMRKR